MEQMKVLLEKAKSDKALMAKLDELGASGAAPDKFVALAAEYGFAITAEDYQMALEQAGTPKTGELKEEELEAAAGGWTENRYQPEYCSQFTKTHYNCVGFMTAFQCDHFSSTATDPLSKYSKYRKKCAMGYFNYVD